MKTMKTIKKLIAFVLLAALTAPTLKVEIAWASVQAPIQDLKIMRTGGTGGTHSVLLQWSPINMADFVQNDPRDMDPPSLNPDYQTYGLQGYELRYNNVTLSTPAVNVAPSPTVNATSFNLMNIAPDRGSIYSFKLVPYHYHPIFTEGVYTGRTTIYPASGASEALLITDIGISAHGENNTLTITWDNPKYGNTNAFLSYNIYVKRKGTTGDVRSVSPFNVTPAQCVETPAIGGNGPKLTYTYTNENISAGDYEVAIEPCDANGEIRKRTTASIRTGANTTVTLPIAYADHSSAYRADATVSLNLTYEMTGKETALLSWGNQLKSYPAEIQKILLFKGNTERELEDVLEAYLRGNNPHPMIEMPGNVTSYPITLAEGGETEYYMIIAKVFSPNNDQPDIISSIKAVIPPARQITPNTPNIQSVSAVPDADFPALVNLDIYWDIFIREQYSSDTPGDTGTAGGFTYDKKVVYELYVTDNYNALYSDSLDPIRTWNPYADSTSLPQLVTDGRAMPAYFYSAPSYRTINNVQKSIEKNKMYYIKIEAYKLTDSGGELPGATPAYASVYVSFDGDISQPPMLQRPPLSLVEATVNSLEITWPEEWSEVYDYSRDLQNGYNPDAPENDPQWQTYASKDGTNIFYGEDAKGLPGIPGAFCTTLDLEQLKRDVLGIEDEVPARLLDLKNVGYEIKYTENGSLLTYDEFIKKVNAQGLEQYLENAMLETAANGWQPLNIVNNDLSAKVEGLQPNTSYVILLRAYRYTLSGEKNYGYANFIAASTLPVQGPIIIDPTAPIVKIVDSETTDTKVMIRWNSTDTIEYVIRYSDVYYSEIAPQGALPVIQIPVEEVMANSTVKLETDGTKSRYYTISGLFPGTEYHFWVGAKSELTNNPFAWSNPVSTKTDDMEAPLPPRGLGLASANDLNLINRQNNTNYAPREKNHLVMEWFKDTNDPKTDGTGTSTQVAEILSHPDLTSVYVARFPGLISNKSYFFRAKTLLTLRLGADRRTTTEYAYVIQMSLEPDFIEFQEIYVPAVPPEESDYVKRTESPWTKTIYFTTSTSDDDYDSDFDPDLVPLPAEDFEISFNGATGTLSYRFRTDGKDANGNYDNRVDQRFISNLVSRNVHNYNIDVSKYGENRILNRVVEVPYTLLKTFDERKINFGIRAGDVTITLPPGAMETAQVKNVQDYGDKAKLQVVFTESPSTMPALGAAQSYAMTPQDVSLYLWTPTQYVEMPYAGKSLDVKLTLRNRADLTDANVGSYVNNEQTSGWSRVASSYDKEAGQLRFNSQPGMYAAISSAAPVSYSFDQTTTPMLNFTSKLGVTDMGQYNGNTPANSNQMINVMNAVANGSSSFQINAVPDTATVSTLQRAGMNISPGASTITREQALASIVRLYEIKTGAQIRPTYTAATTPYTDMAGVQSAYQQAMLKAAEIDLLNGKTAIRPKDLLTIGELFELADVILSDAGL